MNPASPPNTFAQWRLWKPEPYMHSLGSAHRTHLPKACGIWLKRTHIYFFVLPPFFCFLSTFFFLFFFSFFFSFFIFFCCAPFLFLFSPDQIPCDAVSQQAHLRFSIYIVQSTHVHTRTQTHTQSIIFWPKHLCSGVLSTLGVTNPRARWSRGSCHKKHPLMQVRLMHSSSRQIFFFTEKFPRRHAFALKRFCLCALIHNGRFSRHA